MMFLVIYLCNYNERTHYTFHNKGSEKKYLNAVLIFVLLLLKCY